MNRMQVSAARLRMWACAGALLAVAGGACLRPAESGAASLRCAPVVTGAGPGLTKAWVWIVSGRVDCEKSREVIFKALSTSPYEEMQIKGWACKSTDRGGSGVWGARCTRDGERGEEVIRSTLPRRCPRCRKIRQ